MRRFKMGDAQELGMRATEELPTQVPGKTCEANVCRAGLGGGIGRDVLQRSDGIAMTPRIDHRLRKGQPREGHADVSMRARCGDLLR